MEIVILNQCTFHKDFLEIQDICLNTWVADSYESVTIINYFGAYDDKGEPLPWVKFVPEKGGHFYYEENNIRYLILGTNDLIGEWDPRGQKQMMAFEFVNDNFNIDYIYRTGCTSYVVVDKLLERIKYTPRSKTYTGLMSGYTEHDHYFVIGCHMLISRDLFDIVILNKERYLERTNKPMRLGLQVYEDICLGLLLGIDLGLPYINVGSQYIIGGAFNYKESTIDKVVYSPEIDNYRFGKDKPELFSYFHEMLKNI